MPAHPEVRAGLVLTHLPGHTEPLARRPTRETGSTWSICRAVIISGPGPCWATRPLHKPQAGPVCSLTPGCSCPAAHPPGQPGWTSTWTGQVGLGRCHSTQGHAKAVPDLSLPTEDTAGLESILWDGPALEAWGMGTISITSQRLSFVLCKMGMMFAVSEGRYQ